MARNPELDYEFREGKPKEEKVTHIYPTSNFFPNLAQCHLAPEPDVMNQLVHMNRKAGFLGLLKKIAIAAGGIALMLGIMFFLSATNLLPKL